MLFKILLLDATHKRRVTVNFPVAQTLQPSTRLRSGQAPASPKPRVIPTHIPTSADKSFNGITAATGPLTPSDTLLRATRATGFSPPHRVGCSRELPPAPRILLSIRMSDSVATIALDPSPAPTLVPTIPIPSHDDRAEPLGASLLKPSTPSGASLHPNGRFGRPCGCDRRAF